MLKGERPCSRRLLGLNRLRIAYHSDFAGNFFKTLSRPVEQLILPFFHINYIFSLGKTPVMMRRWKPLMVLKLLLLWVVILFIECNWWSNFFKPVLAKNACVESRRSFLLSYLFHTAKSFLVAHERYHRGSNRHCWSYSRLNVSISNLLE
jgi:hypothetical protein